MQYDWPLEQLRDYRSSAAAPHDLADFWRETLAGPTPAAPSFQPTDSGLVAVETYDVTFEGSGPSQPGFLTRGIDDPRAYFSVALMDQTCPPSTVFGAYHAYAGPKRMEVYPYNDHEGGEAHQRTRQLTWLDGRWD